MKNNYMMMYKENKWNLVKKEEMDSVYNHKEDLIIEWFNLNKDPELMKYFNLIQIKMHQIILVHFVNKM